MSRIVTFTINPAIDVSMEIPQLIPDRKLRSSQTHKEPGGGGVNVARALARLGKKSTALIACGGETGLLLTNLLYSEGIDYTPLPISGLTREDYTLYEKSSDASYRLVTPGPTFSEADTKTCMDRASMYIEKEDYFVLSGSLPPGVPDDFYADIISQSNEKGALSIVDTSGLPLAKAAKAGAYLLKPNMRELSQLTEIEINNEEDQLKAAMDLIEYGNCKILVISLGSAGALLVTKEVQHRLRAPNVKVKSKVGAGDSMVAGILFGLSENYPIEKAVQFGIASGAAAVITPGTELCRKNDTLKLFEQLQNS
ncbi:MAG: 1-phosphofructokinase family hexose kinase [Chitinispirillaceae bacterium]|nr:1-phosphofructokinase family hexose kinase [Chitinispirillaceae bacterium]